MSTVMFHVPGIPKPQGSKRHVGGGRLVESSPGLQAWRRAVRFAATQMFTHTKPFTGPVGVALNFRLPRPKSHYRTGRFAGRLRKAAPMLVTTRPDIDKLARAVLDALTGPCYLDDNQVASLQATKKYVDLSSPRAPEQVPGVMIYVTPLCPLPWPAHMYT